MTRDDIPDPLRTPVDLFDQTPPATIRRAASQRPLSPSTEIPFMQRPTCTIKEACFAVGLGRTKLYELIGIGALETTTVGRRRLILVPSLLKFLKADGVKG